VSSIPFVDSAGRLWDTVKIGKYTLPGIATPRGTIARKVDTADVAGEDGATQTHLGYDGAEVEVTLVMWTQAQWDTFTTLARELRPRKGEKNPSPVEVIHPALTALQITNLTLEKISIPEPGAVKGTMESKLSFIEFIPEKKRASKKGKIGSKTGNKSAEEAVAGINPGDVSITGIPTAFAPSASGGEKP